MLYLLTQLNNLYIFFKQKGININHWRGATPVTIDELNQMPHQEFIHALGGIFEHSPWIAEIAAKLKPFSSLQHLHKEMVNIVESSTPAQKLTLIRAHPNLGDRVEMSDNSINEQKGAGLKNLTHQEYLQFMQSNEMYIEKFSFPFILAVRSKSKHEIYEAMTTRIYNDKETEFKTALNEIYKIALLRLEDVIA